ncbi:PspC domain-containing protein [Psychroflexus sediminis]|uniref:Phage shock protein C (PspC) family protein n=1 Tax=Psychroflexus sediminis TaxID=470826 RepID=A0A1G7WQ90_9FLAO|nr:PspC domain-containing protein [Psychroflexus sediminis]SDG74048.1 phage shock protein C (PspC) family protein [Psychroflexus sediminis]
MNKTININLANVFFHIDENAFIKLDRYLKTIESYLAKEESKDEILQDIEARIAELFTESMTHEKQVINLSQVNEMIAIMGEPEAYKIDDEDSTSTSSRARTSRKLYRDIENNYIGGVSAGLHHYLGLNLIVIRLIWIVSALFSFGATVAIYVILWAVTPAARTTAQKLDMQGEPVNLSNIERKVKESYSKFADKVGDIDYDKYGQQTKSGVTKFFDGLGEVLKALGVFISKFLGVILLIISGVVLVGSLIFLFSFGTISIFELGDFTTMEIFSLGVPYWIQVVLFFLVGAIPFFYLLILSLKLLFSNLKSIGKISHITLVGIWILCVIVITTLSIKKELEVSYDAEVVEVKSLALASEDTLRIKMDANLLFSDELRQSKLQKIVQDESNTSRLYSPNVYVNFRTSNDEELKVRVTKKSFGSSESQARERASLIDYDFELQNSNLELDTYLLTQPEFLKEDMKVEVTVYIPKDRIVYLDKSLLDFSRVRNFKRSYYNTYLDYKENTWKPLDSSMKTDSLTLQN